MPPEGRLAAPEQGTKSILRAEGRVVRRRVKLAGWLAAPAAGFMLAAGCGGDGVILDGLVGPPAPVTTLTEIQGTIFTPRCAIPGCHATGFAPFGLVLEPGESWRNLVGVPSAEKPELLRVAPGNVLESYLYLKLCEGTRGTACGEPIAGSPMPLVGPPLTESELAQVAAWILDGAPDN